MLRLLFTDLLIHSAYGLMRCFDLPSLQDLLHMPTIAFGFQAGQQTLYEHAFMSSQAV